MGIPVGYILLAGRDAARSSRPQKRSFFFHLLIEDVYFLLIRDHCTNWQQVRMDNLLHRNGIAQTFSVNTMYYIESRSYRSREGMPVMHMLMGMIQGSLSQEGSTLLEVLDHQNISHANRYRYIEEPQSAVSWEQKNISARLLTGNDGLVFLAYVHLYGQVRIYEQLELACSKFKKACRLCPT